MNSRLLTSLTVDLGLGSTDLLRIIATAPKRYKVYTIPKRTGGYRTIAQPSREVKEIQRHILKNTLSKFPVHPAATGYVKNKNIRDNAELHKAATVLLKLDFHDFFPSIKVHDWERVARDYLSDYSRLDLSFISRILFWGQGTVEPRCLSIGAPTSPALSNIIMYAMDVRLYEIASSAGVAYTRYADDITVSGVDARAVLRFERSARSVIKRTRSPKLELNERKRGLYLPGQRQMVTGLILTPDEKISIGRERKRLISSMVHKFAGGLVSQEQVMIIKGMLGFCLANEPSFVNRLREKYGNGPIDRILHYRMVRR